MAAFFAKKQGGTINVLKLMKLLYLSDRESMSRTGMPITFDGMVSMPHGPVLSRTLNMLSGQTDEGTADLWEEWISDKESHKVNVIRNAERADLDELSDSDIESMEKVWADFGRMGGFALRDWTHAHCPEWQDPNGSSVAIDEADVLKALGRKPEEAAQLAQVIRDQREIDRIFAKL